jgi:hypothetical protein
MTAAALGNKARAQAFWTEPARHHRPTAARQVHLLTFDDTGLIAEHLAIRDDVTVLRQLGALPGDLARP